MGSAVDRIRQMASTPKAGRKKDEKPEMADPTLDEPIGRIIQAKAEIEKWKSILATNEQQVEAVALPVLIASCRHRGQVLTSLRVNGKVTLTRQCRYSAVPVEHRDALAEAFGARMDDYFADTLTISLTEAAASDEAFLKKLMKAMGPDFDTHFTVSRQIAVKEALHNDITLKQDVADKAGPFLETEVLKPAKPSFRQ